jgi:hypothetical protein
MIVPRAKWVRSVIFFLIAGLLIPISSGPAGALRE